MNPNLSTVTSDYYLKNYLTEMVRGGAVKEYLNLSELIKQSPHVWGKLVYLLKLVRRIITCAFVILLHTDPEPRIRTLLLGVNSNNDNA